MLQIIEVHREVKGRKRRSDEKSRICIYNLTKNGKNKHGWDCRKKRIL